jgi:hypothetical protein
MAGQGLPTVTSAKGEEYAVNSPQGRMIWQAAKNRAAKSAAESAVASNGSSGLLEAINANVLSIGQNVETMVSISQAETRGDALNSANVPQDDLQPVTPDEDGIYRGGRDGGGGDDGGLAELGGFSKMIGGLGKGLTMWAGAGPGAIVFTAFLVGLLGVFLAGSIIFKKSAPHIAEGLETLSAADVDTEKVVQIAKAVAAMGGALAAEGLGAAIGSLGSLVSGVVDGLSGFLGIDKRDPMEELKAFAQHEFSEKEIQQIERNARGLSVFGAAMAAHGIGDAVSSIAGLVSGVADGLRSLIPVEEKDPMQEMWDFAQWQFTDEHVAQIQRNALALTAFSTTMAVTETIGVVEDIAKLASGIVNFAASFFPAGADPMVQMKKFADHKFTQAEVDQIELNAKALLAFSTTMGVAKTMGAVGDVTGLFGGIANGISSLFGLEKSDPMADMKLFAKEKITQEEADQISLNANALVNFSKAMALYSASGAAADALDLVGNIAKGITSFFGGTSGIDYEEIKTFAESGIDKYETQITTNARVLGAFSLAMSEHASNQSGLEWQNIGTNILGAVGSIFGGKPEDKIPYDEITAFAAVDWDETVKNKVVTNAETLHAYTKAVSKMADIKTEEGFWSSLGSAFSGAFSALLGQDTLPIEDIERFTETTLDLAVVDNNISAIEKFMTFGTTLADWEPGDTGKFSDFAAGLVGISHGIEYALYGGEKKFVIPGWADNIRIKEGQGLASIDLMDMQNSAKGIAVLRHSLIAQEPLQALQAASSAMDASTGNVTVVNANNNSTNNSSTSQNNYQEMNVDHNEQSGSWYSRIDWTPWN